MSLSANWVRSTVLVLVIAVSTIGFYINSLNDNSLQLYRTAEIKLNEFEVIEDVCVYGDILYLVGSKFESSIQQSYAVLMKISQKGEIVWHTNWKNEWGSYGRRVACNINGVYVIGEKRRNSIFDTSI